MTQLWCQLSLIPKKVSQILIKGLFINYDVSKLAIETLQE